MAKTSKNQFIGRQSTVFLLLFLRNIRRLSPDRVSTVDRRQLSVRVSTLACGLLLIATAMAQRPTTPPLDLPLVSDLETSLQAFYQDERDAQLTAFDTKQSGNWKDLLPTVGVGYTFDNTPRPTVSWSPISILNRKDNRRKEALTRDAMLRSYDVLISDRLFKLRQLVSDYFIDFDALKAKEAALQLDELLYDIVEESYKANRVDPKEYLQEQKKILLARTSVDTYKQELHKKRSEVIYVAKWEENN